MTGPSPPADSARPVPAAADGAAAAAAQRAGVRLRPLDTLPAVQAAAALFAQVWRTEPSRPPVSAEVMRAVEHAGGYVVGAYDDDRLVGASAGFLGLADGAPVLHSHISGVLAGGRGTGLALKLHQRAWALHHGIAAVTWTFDPLVRRNAWFNLAKLGATGVEYLVDFYGPLRDGVNAGESSDRLFTRWDLLAPARGAASSAGATVVLDERAGRPHRLPVPAGSAGPLLVRLPPDVEALRTQDPSLARDWRLAVRDALVPAFAGGCTARGMTSDGCLLLAR